MPWSVLVIHGLMVLALLAISGDYGFHGDEMYYVVVGQHRAFGCGPAFVDAVALRGVGGTPRCLPDRSAPAPCCRDGTGS